MVVFGNTRLTERHISRRDINTAALREMLSHYLEFLNLSSQGRVGADMLEERRLKANPQVGFLPVTVFLKDREGGDANRDIYKTHNPPKSSTTKHPCSSPAVRTLSR